MAVSSVLGTLRMPARGAADNYVEDRETSIKFV
jgi:hypothetical protein